MLREFIKCNGLAERIQLIDNSVPKDWDEAELNTVCEIVGIADKVEGMEAEEKLEVLRAALTNKLDETLDDTTTIKEISKLSEEEVLPTDEEEKKDRLRQAAVAHIGENYLNRDKPIQETRMEVSGTDSLAPACS